MSDQRSARVQAAIIAGVLLLAWAALCFWAGLGFAFVAALLLLVAIVPLALVGGHRFVPRSYVIAEIALLLAAGAVAVITGFNLAGVIAVGAVLGADTIVCSLLVLSRARGAIRNATRNLLVILVALGVATGASAVVSALAPVPTCGIATVGVGGATTPGSANAGQCFVAAGENCVARTLTVIDSSAEERASHRYRVFQDSDGRCHFTDTVEYGPPSNPTLHSAMYNCPALAAQVGAPGQQEVQLTQCTGVVIAGAASPIIPMNAYQPLPSPTPAPG